MPSNLSHCLFAVMVCGAVNLVTGLPPLSSSIFFAGFIAMLINLDYSAETGKNRTPWIHSIVSGIALPLIFALIIHLLFMVGVLAGGLALEVSIGFCVGIVTHIILDFFTCDGIYIFNRGEWRIINSKRIGFVPHDDGSTLLNIYLSIPSAVGIMILVGIMSI
jgi:hypothetical protein